VYVGLAVTSARAGASTTATVSNFAVSTNLSNTIVTSYRLNIYAAGADTLTDTPVATSDLGKPTPDAQQTITVDRGPFFTALPAGSYLATVTAIGPGGSAQSQPPVAFTR
jgi:hypothetical protein